MTAKLTLSIEDEIIASAKKYARDHGKSLSNIIENYLRSITTNHRKPKAHAPQVTKLMGVIQLPDNFDYKKEISDAVTLKTLKSVR